MATDSVPEVSTSQVEAILAEPRATVKPMEWAEKMSGRAPLWLEYISACQMGAEVRDDVLVRIKFRPAKILHIGHASIVCGEQFDAAVCVGRHRIYALDTTDKPHTNTCGIGRPWNGCVIDDRTHEHTWSEEGYGYAEPVRPALLSVESLIAEFLKRANVSIPGGFVHPLKGKQGELEL